MSKSSVSIAANLAMQLAIPELIIGAGTAALFNKAKREAMDDLRNAATQALQYPAEKTLSELIEAAEAVKAVYVVLEGHNNASR